MQHISFLALRHTVTPTNIFSNTFDNSVREWCFIASTNVNNAYEKAECVIYTASVINQAAVQLAGSGSDLVVVFPSSLKIMIINIDGKLEGGGGLVYPGAILGGASPCSCADWVCTTGAHCIGNSRLCYSEHCAAEWED